MQTLVVRDEEEVIKRLSCEIASLLPERQEQNYVFRVGLSGGSVLNYLVSALPKIQTDFTKWKFYFCDERYVPESNADSTFGAYKSQLLPVLGLHESQFVKINLQLPLEACAAEYEQRIKAHFGQELPAFDLLLLGMGPDGHTCSLFPQHPLLQEQTKLIAAIADSPKPPAQRITMTLPLINNAKCCIFAMCGNGKAEMFKRVFVDHEDLPAAKVKPKSGKLFCILDCAAAQYIATTGLLMM